VADIHLLPGVARNDVGPRVPIEELLQAVAEAGMTNVIVLGYGREGFSLWSSDPDLDRNVGMIERAKLEMLCTDSDDLFDRKDSG
jgi:hypothetical protein